MKWCLARMRASLLFLLFSACATARHAGPTAPSGWKVERLADRTVLAAPEGSLRVSLTTSTELELARLTPVALTRTPPRRGWAVSASGEAPGLRVEVRQFEGVSYVFSVEGDEASRAKRRSTRSSTA